MKFASWETKLSGSFLLLIQKPIDYSMKVWQQTSLMIGMPRKEKRRMKLDFKTCSYSSHKKNCWLVTISFQVSISRVTCATQKGNTTNSKDKVGPCQFFEKWKETHVAYFALLCNFLLRSILTSSSSSYTFRVGSATSSSAGLNVFLVEEIF